MKNCGINVTGRYLYCFDEINCYGGYVLESIKAFVYGGPFITDKYINFENIQFENIGYVDFNVNTAYDKVEEDEDEDSRDGELEFYEEDLKEFKSKLEKKTNATLKYIESELKVYFGELRYNGNVTGVNVVKCICFRDNEIELY